MSNFLITPILLHYNFLETLCREAAALLSLDLSDASKYQQFKMAIFLSFNRYLSDSLLFLPKEEAEKLLARLTPALESGNEEQTLEILNSQINFFPEIRSEFLNIIKTLNK